MTSREAIREAAAHEIFRIALEGLADRMQDSLLRAACSVVAREGMDCAAALFLPDGRVLAQSSSLPLLLGGMIPAIRGLLDRFPADTMQEGDGYLQNDPWSGGTHLPDIIVVRPVRVHEQTVALAATILHHQDVGGLAAGSVPPDARDIFQEGLRVPPVQWRRNGMEDASIAAILAANSRAPDLLRGDLGAQWAAATLGAREIGSLVQAMGISAFAQASDALIDHARRMTETALGALHDGAATVDDALDGDGLSDRPVPLRVTVRKTGGRERPHLAIDFTGSSPQTAGPVNAAPSGLVAAAFAVMRHLAPDAPANHGMLAPVTLTLPEGSVVNPRFPAAVNARTATVKLACNAMLAAVSRLGEPDEVRASNGAVAVVLSAGGHDDAGRNWFFTEIIASGSGGGPAGPGVPGHLHRCQQCAQRAGRDAGDRRADPGRNHHAPPWIGRRRVCIPAAMACAAPIGSCRAARWRPIAASGTPAVLWVRRAAARARHPRPLSSAATATSKRLPPRRALSGMPATGSSSKRRAAAAGGCPPHPRNKEYPTCSPVATP